MLSSVFRQRNGSSEAKWLLTALKELVLEVEVEGWSPLVPVMFTPDRCILAWMGFKAHHLGHAEGAHTIIILQELSVGMIHVFENTIVHHQSNHLPVTEGFMQL